MSLLCTGSSIFGHCFSHRLHAPSQIETKSVESQCNCIKLSRNWPGALCLGLFSVNSIYLTFCSSGFEFITLDFRVRPAGRFDFQTSPFPEDLPFEQWRPMSLDPGPMQHVLGCARSQWCVCLLLDGRRPTNTAARNTHIAATLKSCTDPVYR